MNETKTTGAAYRGLLATAAFVVVVAGLDAVQTIVIQVIIALFVTIVLVPGLTWLVRHHVPRFVAILVLIAVAIGVVAGVGAVVGNAVNDFTRELPTYQARFDGLSDSVTAWLARYDVKLQTSTVFKMVRPGSIFSMLGGTLRGVAAVLSNTFMILLIVVFMLMEWTDFPAKVRAAFADGELRNERLNRMSTEVQRYLGIKTLLSLATGILIAVWLAILGVDFAVLWGLIAFALNFIPNIGSIIAAVPAVLLALIQLGPGRALLVVAGYLAVNTVIGNFIEPKLMGQSLGLSPLVVILSMVFWGWLWGPMGMLLSVPLTMIVKISLESNPDLRWVAILLDSRPPEERSAPDEAGG